MPRWPLQNLPKVGCNDFKYVSPLRGWTATLVRRGFIVVVVARRLYSRNKLSRRGLIAFFISGRLNNFTKCNFRLSPTLRKLRANIYVYRYIETYKLTCFLSGARSQNTTTIRLCTTVQIPFFPRISCAFRN